MSREELRRYQREMKKEMSASREERRKKLASNPVESSGREKLWRAIRVLRRFTRTDLAITTGQSMGSVTDYTKRLRRAGYIRPEGRGRSTVWNLVKDPGPKRPGGLDGGA